MKDKFSKLVEALNRQVDKNELKALAKEDIFDKKGPRTVAQGGPRIPKTRLAKFLKNQETKQKQNLHEE